MHSTPRRVNALSIALFSLGLFTACAQAQYPRGQSPSERYSQDRSDQGDIRTASYSRISLRQAKRDLADYRNQSVRWGGIIASVENRHGETWIEIVEQPLDWRGRPEADDESAGRFIAILPDFADPAIYRVGREITVVGRLLWPYKRRIGDHDYSYALLDTTAHELWDAREERERIVYRTYSTYRTVDIYDPWFYPWPVYPHVYYRVHHHHHVHFPRPPVIIVQPPPVVVLPPHHPHHPPRDGRHPPGSGQETPHVPRGPCLQEDRTALPCERLPRGGGEDPRQIAEDTRAPVLTPGQLFPEDGQAQVQPVAVQPFEPAAGGAPAPGGPAQPEERIRGRRLDAERLREYRADHGGDKRPPILINEDPRPLPPAAENLQTPRSEGPVRELRTLPEPESERRREPQFRPNPIERSREPAFRPEAIEYRRAAEARPDPIERRREPEPRPTYEPRREPVPLYQPAPTPAPTYTPPPPEPRHEREHERERGRERERERESPQTRNERIE
ncbi:MAG: Slp family lipoprotein [Gammaproteobacteria bacterium]|nr:Slp family lipoprotein [Gammaproteobacteria bacterium]